MGWFATLRQTYHLTFVSESYRVTRASDSDPVVKKKGSLDLHAPRVFCHGLGVRDLSSDFRTPTAAFPWQGHGTSHDGKMPWIHMLACHGQLASWKTVAMPWKSRVIGESSCIPKNCHERPRTAMAPVAATSLLRRGHGMGESIVALSYCHGSPWQCHSTTWRAKGRHGVCHVAP